VKLKTKEFVLLLTFLLLGAIYLAPRANANPDPLLVSWFITDTAGTPIDGAKVKIYWSTSTSGPFKPMDSSIVEDKIAGVFKNPVITGYWNPDHPHGMAVADLHITNVASYFFYVGITFPDGTVQNWPMVDSYKPGDPTWMPVAASGSPSGYAASGNGFGNGPTTAYPNQPPPPPVIPEVPFGTVVSFLSMFAVLAGFVGVRRFRPKSH